MASVAAEKEIDDHLTNLWKEFDDCRANCFEALQQPDQLKVSIFSRILESLHSLIVKNDKIHAIAEQHKLPQVVTSSKLAYEIGELQKDLENQLHETKAHIEKLHQDKEALSGILKNDFAKLTENVEEIKAKIDSKVLDTKTLAEKIATLESATNSLNEIQNTVGLLTEKAKTVNYKVPALAKDVDSTKKAAEKRLNEYRNQQKHHREKLEQRLKKVEDNTKDAFTNSSPDALIEFPVLTDKERVLEQIFANLSPYEHELTDIDAQANEIGVSFERQVIVARDNLKQVMDSCHDKLEVVRKEKQARDQEKAEAERKIQAEMEELKRELENIQGKVESGDFASKNPEERLHILKELQPRLIASKEKVQDLSGQSERFGISDELRSFLSWLTTLHMQLHQSTKQAEVNANTEKENLLKASNEKKEAEDRLTNQYQTLEREIERISSQLRSDALNSMKPEDQLKLLSKLSSKLQPLWDSVRKVMPEVEQRGFWTLNWKSLEENLSKLGQEISDAERKQNEKQEEERRKQESVNQLKQQVDNLKHAIDPDVLISMDSKLKRLPEKDSEKEAVLKVNLVYFI